MVQLQSSVVSVCRRDAGRLIRVSALMVQDDGTTEGRVQRYRQAPACLDAAVDYWLQHATDLAFVLTLGDIIDGNVTPEKTDADLERVACKFDRLVSGMPSRHGCYDVLLLGAPCWLSRNTQGIMLGIMQAEKLPVHHVVGNHCLAVGRAALLPRLGVEGATAYRTIPIAPGWRLIILDTTVMRATNDPRHCHIHPNMAAAAWP
jgi:hypothetical protein